MLTLRPCSLCQNLVDYGNTRTACILLFFYFLLDLSKCEHIIYCTKLVAWRIRQDNACLELVQTGGTDTEAPKQNILSLPTIVIHWHHLFFILLLFCCNCFLPLIFFFFNLITWSWNKAKSASYCSFYVHSSHDERWRLFQRQLQWLVQLWLEDQSKSHITDNAWL